MWTPAHTVDGAAGQGERHSSDRENGLGQFQTVLSLEGTKRKINEGLKTLCLTTKVKNGVVYAPEIREDGGAGLMDF